jgi:hypothetical protein
VYRLYTGLGYIGDIPVYTGLGYIGDIAVYGLGYIPRNQGYVA